MPARAFKPLTLCAPASPATLRRFTGMRALGTRWQKRPAGRALFGPEMLHLIGEGASAGFGLEWVGASTSWCSDRVQPRLSPVSAWPYCRPDLNRISTARTAANSDFERFTIAVELLADSK